MMETFANNGCLEIRVGIGDGEDAHCFDEFLQEVLVVE
jgi:hypothetical protein